MATNSPEVAARATEWLAGVVGAAATSAMRTGGLVAWCTGCDAGGSDCTPCRVIVDRGAGTGATTLFGTGASGVDG